MALSPRMMQMLNEINARWYSYLSHKGKDSSRRCLIEATIPMVQHYAKIMTKKWGMLEMREEIESQAYILVIEIINAKRTGRLTKGRTFGSFVMFKLYRSMGNWLMREKRRRGRFEEFPDLDE